MYDVACVCALFFVGLQEKAVVKKHESSLTALPAVPEYFIDRVNNGCVPLAVAGYCWGSTHH